MDDEIALHSVRNFSKEELLRLLSYFEGEIQARDIVIAALKVTSRSFVFFFCFQLITFLVKILSGKFCYVNDLKIVYCLHGTSGNFVKSSSPYRKYNLQSEKAKQLLHEAKYGQLTGSDPIKALQRDSSLADEENEVDESAIGQMYETQLIQLERLITVQRRCHNRSKQVKIDLNLSKHTKYRFRHVKNSSQLSVKAKKLSLTRYWTV